MGDLIIMLPRGLVPRRRKAALAPVFFTACIALLARTTRGFSSSYLSTAVDHLDCPGFATIADGCCDPDNNAPECGFDGGDCCPCTREGVATCGGNDGYDCRDPSVECGRDEAGGGASASEYPYCNGTIAHIGDGFCDDEELNSPQCGYDGGDCCSCTCDLRSDVDFSCTSVFVCRDPYADCGSSLSSAEFNYLDRGCTVQRIGDGSCNEVNNVEDCLWDGGDCCSCTCSDGPAYVCGTTPGDFDCQDPNSRCDSEMVWVPAVGAVLGVVALGFGCFAIYRYGVRKRREMAVSAAIASVFGAVGVEPSSSQRSSQITSRIDDEALAVAQ